MQQDQGRSARRVIDPLCVVELDLSRVEFGFGHHRFRQFYVTQAVRRRL